MVPSATFRPPARRAIVASARRRRRPTSGMPSVSTRTRTRAMISGFGLVGFGMINHLSLEVCRTQGPELPRLLPAFFPLLLDAGPPIGNQGPGQALAVPAPLVQPHQGQH